MTRWPVAVSDLPSVVEWGTWRGPWPWRRHTGTGADHVVVSMLPWVRSAHIGLARLRDLTAVGVLLLLALRLVGPGSLAPALQAGLWVVVTVKVLVAITGSVWALRVRADVSGAWVLVDHAAEELVAATRARTVRPAQPPVLPGRAASGARPSGATASDQ